VRTVSDHALMQEAITAVYSDNYRPVQPVNGRTVEITPVP